MEHGSLRIVCTRYDDAGALLVLPSPPPPPPPWVNVSLNAFEVSLKFLWHPWVDFVFAPCSPDGGVASCKHAVLDWTTNTGGGAMLSDAFEPLHQWDKAHASHVPTSRNSVRSEHIDYLFYDTRALAVQQIALKPPPTAIPSFDEPSDHVPVGAVFSWL